MIEDFLQSIGLTSQETSVYMYLLTHGESIVSIVAKRIGMKRPTVYQALEALEKRKIVGSARKNGVAHFHAKNPEMLITLCNVQVQKAQEHLKKAQSLQEQLQKLQATGGMTNVERFENIQYYEGLSAVTDLIDETLTANVGERLCYCFGLNTYHTELAGNDWQHYTKKRVDQKMFVKSIQPDIKAAIAYKKRDKKELRDTRLVPKNLFPSECEINLIGDMIAMFSAAGRVPTGLKLKNKKMATALRSLFLLAWEQARHYGDEAS
ncbi:MAG: transcriptional regulator TrmB [Candidatus Peregrinibacteria bacterium Greene1014_49]|nr:MAG: transcriptional regulator TrmB [Candidatus Peregrinibacteria bacterium Greene1014_49]